MNLIMFIENPKMLPESVRERSLEHRVLFCVLRPVHHLVDLIAKNWNRNTLRIHCECSLTPNMRDFNQF